MAEKKTYELLDGQHWESVRKAGQNGPFDMGEQTHHRADDTETRFVQSERPLNELFPNKFRLVQQDAGPLTLAQKEVRKSAVDELLKTGEWTEDDREMLEALPDKHFGRMVERSGSRAARAARDRPVDAATGQIGPERQEDAQKRAEEHRSREPEQVPNRGDGARQAEQQKPKRSRFGEDVTERFPRAQQMGLKVWANPAGKHQLTTAQDDKTALTDKAMKAEEVEPFLAEYGDKVAPQQPKQE